MTRADLSRWSLTVALLVTPAALQAQAPDSDSATTSSTKKAPDPAATAAVVCRDGTAGAGAQSCAGHGGVDAVTTNAARTGRVERHPISGQGGMPADTGIRIKTDTSQPPGWGIPPDRTDSARTVGDSGRAS
jgi:hypothetical protein